MSGINYGIDPADFELIILSSQLHDMGKIGIPDYILQKTGKYTDEELAEVRQLARDAQFYWDFVFVENSEGVHNPALARDCLNRAESLGSQAAVALVALTT